MGGILFIERMLHDTRRKAEHQWVFSDLVAAISVALHESFVRSTKYAYSVSQLLLYWMYLLCCIYDDFVRPLNAFLQSFCHSCAVKKHCANTLRCYRAAWILSKHFWSLHPLFTSLVKVSRKRMTFFTEHSHGNVFSFSFKHMIVKRYWSAHVNTRYIHS